MGEQKRGGEENKQQDIFLTTWSTLIKSFHIYFIFIYISSYINLSAIWTSFLLLTYSPVVDLEELSLLKKMIHQCSPLSWGSVEIKLGLWQ